MADKPEGRGRGKYTAAGKQAEQEARIEALEEAVRKLEAEVFPEPVEPPEGFAPTTSA